jgi:N-acetylneuraminic acid mutarotase
MRYFLPLILFFASFSSNAQKSFTWSRIADYPAAHWGMASCSLDGYLYSYGACGAGSNVLYRYSPQADKWDTLATLTAGTICQTSLAGINGKLYLPHTQGLYVYDVNNNQWEPTAISYPPGFKHLGAIAVVKGDDIYYVAGSNTKNLYKFNSTSRTFTQLADMAIGRDLPQAVLLNDKIYVFAGRASLQALSSAEVYDIATDSWQDITPAVSKRYFGHAITDGTYIYIMGGETGAVSHKYKTIEVYEPANNSVTILDTAINDMDYHHTAFCFGVVNNKVIAASGYTNVPSLDHVTKYSEAANFQSTANVLNTMKQQIDFTLYPNPARDIVHIAMNNATDAHIEIYNTAGSLVLSKDMSGKARAIDIAELPTGIYVVRVRKGAFTQARLLQIAR